jgi:two-component system, NtrC family, sensor kinase
MKISVKLKGLYISAILFLIFGICVTPASPAWADDHSSPPYLLLGSSNYPPYEYLEYGKPTGLVTDLVAEIEKESHLELGYQLMKWSQAQELVLSGKGIGHPNMATTPERQLKYDFAIKMVNVEFTLFVNKNATWAKSIADFSNKSVGVTKSSLPDQVIKHDYPEIQRVFFNNDLDGLGKLISGEIDAFATGRLPGLYVLNKHGVESIVPIVENLAEMGLGIALLKGNAELLKQFNASIERLKKSGRLDEIKQKWLSQYSLKSKSFWSSWTVQLIGGAVVMIVLVLVLIARARRSKRNS